MDVLVEELKQGRDEFVERVAEGRRLLKGGDLDGAEVYIRGCRQCGGSGYELGALKVLICEKYSKYH